MALYVPGKKTKPGTAGLTSAEIRLRRRNASGSEDTPTAPPAAPSTLEELLAEREQLYSSLHVSQNVQARALALTGRLEQRFATERKSLEEQISTLKDGEKALTEANERYKNDLDQEIEKCQRLDGEKVQFEVLLLTERKDHERTKQSLQSALEEECCKGAELGNNIAEMKQQLQSAQKTVKSQQTSTQQLQADIERQNEVILTLKTENAKAQDNLVFQQQANVKKQKECEQWKSTTDTLQHINRQLKEEIERQSKDVLRLITENAKVQNDLVVEQQANTKLQEECEQLKGRFNDAETSNKSTIAEMRRKLKQDEDARHAAESSENELRNTVAKLLKEIDHKESRIQELEVIYKSEERTENTVSQEMPESQPSADVNNHDDDSIVQNEVDSDSSSTGRGRSPVKVKSSEASLERRKRKRIISSRSSSGLKIDTFLINKKKRQYIPSRPSSSGFSLKTFLIDPRSNLDKDRSHRSSGSSSKRTAKESLLSVSRGRRKSPLDKLRSLYSTRQTTPKTPPSTDAPPKLSPEKRSSSSRQSQSASLVVKHDLDIAMSDNEWSKTVVI